MTDPVILIHVAASLLWSWLGEARRKWAFEPDCILALQTFRLGEYRERLTEEQARAAFSLAVCQNLIAVGDAKAASLYYASFGYEPKEGDVIVRAKDQNDT